MRHPLIPVALIAAALTLSSCETMQSGMTDMKQAFSHINLFGKTDTNETAQLALPLNDQNGKPTACLPVTIAPDARQIHQFTVETQPRQEDLISSAGIESASDTCQAVRDNMAIDVVLNFSGDVGSKGRQRPGDKPSFAYPYYVTISDAQGNIVTQEVFAITLTYDGTQIHQENTDQIRQMIPARADFKSYKIEVGFQLSDEEMAYNRTLK